ncbi:HNH endonuclease signature motif containing protein [Sinorhizobium meliloti]|uniref:HNH endonuclease signature motif containing protein n=1 Tax=Rhizobium meliloti TaxID=382 RepID=UPI0039882F07
MCQGCETAPATEVDHITPIGKGGAPRDRANLQSLCKPCHVSKTHADKARRTWTPPKYRGCDEQGNPRNPSHPWAVQSPDRPFLDRLGPTKKS